VGYRPSYHSHEYRTQREWLKYFNDLLSKYEAGSEQWLIIKQQIASCEERIKGRNMKGQFKGEPILTKEARLGTN